MFKNKKEQYSEDLYRDDVISFLHKLVHGDRGNLVEKCNTVDVRFLVVSDLDPADMGYVYEYMHSYLELNKGYYIVNYQDFCNYVPEYQALNQVIDLSKLMETNMYKKSCVYEVLLTFDNEGKLKDRFIRVLPLHVLINSSIDSSDVKLSRNR